MIDAGARLLRNTALRYLEDAAWYSKRSSCLFVPFTRIFCIYSLLFAIPVRSCRTELFSGNDVWWCLCNGDAQRLVRIRLWSLNFCNVKIHERRSATRKTYTLLGEWSRRRRMYQSSRLKPCSEIQWTLELRPAWQTNNLGYDQNFSFDLRPKSWVTTRMPVKAKTRGCKQRPEMRS